MTTSGGEFETPPSSLEVVAERGAVQSMTRGHHEPLFWVAGAVGLTLVAHALLSYARRVVDQGSCQKGLMMVSTGVQLYATDYDDRLPPAARWQDVLYPYVKSEGIWNCPGDHRQRLVGTGSYAWNAYLDGLPMSRLPDPEQQVVLFDAEAWERNAVSRGGAYAARHEGGAMVVFLDGRTRYQGSASHLRLAPMKLPPTASKQGTRR